MKRIKLLFVCCCILALAGCSKEFVFSDPDVLSKSIDSSYDCFVCYDQVRDYANTIRPQTKSNGDQDYAITPYGSVDGSPLLYIINFGEGDGWQILSSDARTPAIIAEGKTGYFSTEDGSPTVQIWLDCMAADIAAVRRSSDEELTFSPEEISANKLFWHIGGGTRDEGEGHWEVTVSYEVIVTEEVEHMTPRWDQDAPYNIYCPLTLNSSSVRVPAGCVAVAASEVLYYLHNKLGVPVTTASYGYCTGDIFNYTQYFSNPNSTVWAQMDTTSLYSFETPGPETILIGSAGLAVNMHFDYNIFTGDYFSWALPANIRTQLFSPNGISSSHGDYDATTVKNNLENYMPVIVTASDQLIPANGDIHCFVIDGFQKTYTKYTYYHYWVVDGNMKSRAHPDPDHLPYITYAQSSPAITAIKINWGWKSQWHTPYVNDGWYALTADWTVNNGGTHNYNHNVQMIYDIAISE